MNTTSTPADFRAAAADARKASADSWDRSDTDGFVSQWASDTMARRYDHAAQVAEAGWKMDTLALFFNGEVASLDQRDGQFGFYWVLNDAATEAFGKRFYNPSKARKSIEADRKRGFTYGTVRVEAYWDDRAGRATEDRTAIREGRFEVIATDGAHSDVESSEAA